MTESSGGRGSKPIMGWVVTSWNTDHSHLFCFLCNCWWVKNPDHDVQHLDVDFKVMIIEQVSHLAFSNQINKYLLSKTLDQDSFTLLNCVLYIYLFMSMTHWNFNIFPFGSIFLLKADRKWLPWSRTGERVGGCSSVHSGTSAAAWNRAHVEAQRDIFILQSLLRFRHNWHVWQWAPVLLSWCRRDSSLSSSWRRDQAL